MEREDLLLRSIDRLTGAVLNLDESKRQHERLFIRTVREILAQNDEQCEGKYFSAADCVQYILEALDDYDNRP